MRLFFRIAIFIFILLIGIAGIFIYHTLYNQLPNHSATLKVQGLNSTVDVHWDPYGVPYIYAGSEEDLFFTVGYLHAQDRLWQLTLSQLLAEGRFSEYLGPEFLEIDKHQRTIGIWNTAKKIIDELPDSTLSILERYSDGVNAYVRSNKNRLPVEMTLLGLEPPTWTPTHSVAVARLMAWDQNMHWKSGLSLALIGEEIGAGRIRQLLPGYSTDFLSEAALDAKTLRSVAESFLAQEEKTRSVLQKEGSAVGSNAWAVNSSKTTSRRPILAGDPHMGLSIPGFWYEAHLNAPGFSITGATIPGAPFAVLGQNSQIAWSITNMMADDTDFFLIQPDPVDPGQYVADSLNGEAVFERYRWQQEIITIAGADDYYYRIPHTRHGPIINSVHPDSAETGLRPVAMKWAGHEVSDEISSLYGMNKASNLEEFTEALSHFGSPSMNFIYADNSDNIALIGAGLLPIRSGDPVQFRQGWDSENDWQGFIPFEELPREINPDRGYVANANNPVLTDNSDHYIGRFFAPSSRISRISYLLDENNALNTEAMQQIQNDIYSEHAAELTEYFIPLLRSAQQDGEFNMVLSYLENWDFRYSTNSTAAMLFDLFFLNLSEEILTNEIPVELYKGLIRLEYIPVRMMTHLLTDGSSLFNIVDEENVQFRNRTVRSAMLRTLDMLNQELGAEPFEWRWESLHTLTLRPPLLGDISDHPDSPAALRLIVNNLLSRGPYSAPGHGMTINKAEYSWSNPFSVTLGPSIRRIVDFNSPHRSLSVLPTGQSGHPLSANYGDQSDLWLDGRYRYIYNDSTFFREVNHSTMKLEPLSIH